jgi:hypothetical protein
VSVPAARLDEGVEHVEDGALIGECRELLHPPQASQEAGGRGARLGR